MSTDMIIVTLISSIISGILATIITLYINHKTEQQKIKRELVDDIFGFRYQLSSSGQAGDKHELIRAINRIPIVFDKNKEVLEAYDKLFEILPNATTSSSTKDDVLVTLYKELCKAAKINVSDWNDSKIVRVFTIK